MQLNFVHFSVVQVIKLIWIILSGPLLILVILVSCWSKIRFVLQAYYLLIYLFEFEFKLYCKIYIKKKLFLLLNVTLYKFTLFFFKKIELVWIQNGLLPVFINRITHLFTAFLHHRAIITNNLLEEATGPPYKTTLAFSPHFFGPSTKEERTEDKLFSHLHLYLHFFLEQKNSTIALIINRTHTNSLYPRSQPPSAT